MQDAEANARPMPKKMDETYVVYLEPPDSRT